VKFVVIGPVYPYRGGIAHYTSQLTKSLIENGHKTVTFSFRRQYPAWLYPGKSDKEPSHTGFKSNAEYTLDPIYPWTWINTAKAIAEIDPDAVLIQWWTTFWSIAFWSLSSLLRKYGLKVIYIIHNVAPHEPLPWDNWLVSKVLKNGAAFIVQSPNELERLQSLLPNANSILCSLPVFNQFAIETKISKTEAKHLLGLKNTHPMVLFFGIVRPYKGLKYAIQAISILKSKGIKFHLVVAGEFWENIHDYEEQINQLELSDQITIFDRYIPNEEVSLFFTAADLFIAPYIGGTQSGSVKIALYFNLPIIITDCISDELLAKSNLVTIVPSKNSESLANAMVELIAGDLPDFTQATNQDTSWSQLITAIENLTLQDQENLDGV
jgi:glycosyltransferase involved in cell wall biosynthesis